MTVEVFANSAMLVTPEPSPALPYQLKVYRLDAMRNIEAAINQNLPQTEAEAQQWIGQRARIRRQVQPQVESAARASPWPPTTGSAAFRPSSSTARPWSTASGGRAAGPGAGAPPAGRQAMTIRTALQLLARRCLLAPGVGPGLFHGVFLRGQTPSPRR